MGKKNKKSKKSKSSGPPADGSQSIGKARRRNRMVIYAVVGFVVVAWLAVFVGFIIRWLGVGGPTTPNG
jgi:hypothetical protein